MRFPEELLHFIWQFRLYDQLNLESTEGEQIRVLDVGQHNRNAGPDFEFATLFIGATRWCGHVEIHWSSRDWVIHQHSSDPKYNSTVLHVVWVHDQEVYREDGTVLPVVELKDRVAHQLLSRYQDLMGNLSWIPCQEQWRDNVEGLTGVSWLERMIIERLESKASYFKEWLRQTNYHWEKVLLIALSRAFGMKVNAVPFERLAEQVDFALLARYHKDKRSLEALLFGVSDLLPQDAKGDSYVQELVDEFAYLRKKHSLIPLSKVEWKYHRMRPYNFPTFRLAQLSALYHKEVYWFQKIMDLNNVQDVVGWFQDVEVDDYWSEHFQFGLPTTRHARGFSGPFIEHLILNCFVPILFLYGTYVDEEKYKNKALGWLGELKKEKNIITSKFEVIGAVNNSAATSQGLLHLYHAYCSQKKCLTCGIGLQILKS